MKRMCCASAVITLLPLVLLPPPSAAQFNQRFDPQFNQRFNPQFNQRFNPQFNQRRQVPQSCRTPDNFFGSCVPLSSCTQAVEIFKTTSYDRATQYVIGLKNSCNIPSTNGNPVICCKYLQSVTERPREFITTERPFIGPQFPPQDPENPFVIPTRRSTTTTSTTPRTTTTTSTTTTRTIAPIPVTSFKPLIDQRGPWCRGPNTKTGYCIELGQCDSLLSQLLDKPKDQNFKGFLHASRRVCKNQGYQVCCPNEERITTPSSNIRPTSASLIPRNSDEVPRRLLNMEDGCGYTSVPKNKIVGGVVSHIGAWPWIALLGYKDPRFPFQCGGSLITARHVLTAAHCITLNLTFVRLGEHDVTTDKETRHVDLRIARFVIHPNYNPRNGRSDLAILYLARNVEFTTKITPICLPHTPDLRQKSYLRYNPFVAGWGHTMENGTSATVLNELQVPIIENVICAQSFVNHRGFLRTADQFDKAVICAGDLSGGKDSCQGDSGGPLMMPELYEDTFRYHLIGVVSYGIEGCARPETPGVYTSTQYFMDWIIQQVQNTP
ncbi:venom serine protease Bi-VSP-like [Drosophila takahashii]|uniref:venom serine protease Bi-VSP-like n=1 Tax=Drosophila takahashii TaxID=29030 RepID=UPI00389902EB